MAGDGGCFARLGALARGYLGHFQALCYLLSVILGLFVVIPVGVVLRNFHGKCILYAQLVWDNEVVYPWSEAACDFVLYMTLAVAIIYAGLMAIFTIIAILPKKSSNPYISSASRIQAYNLRYLLISLNPAFVFIDCIIFALMLGSALIISTGLGEFCKDLVKSMDEAGTPIGTCINSKDIDWMKIRVEGGMDHGVYGGSFYGLYSVASIAAWLLVVVWGILLIGDFSHCCRGCVCNRAVEKQRLDKSFKIAAHRSRIPTAIGTPEGIGTPRSYGQVPLAAQGYHHPQPHQQRPVMGAYGYGVPSQAYGHPAQVHLPPKY